MVKAYLSPHCPLHGNFYKKKAREAQNESHVVVVITTYWPNRIIPAEMSLLILAEMPGSFMYS